MKQNCFPTFKIKLLSGNFKVVFSDEHSLYKCNKFITLGHDIKVKYKEPGWSIIEFREVLLNPGTELYNWLEKRHLI